MKIHFKCQGSLGTIDAMTRIDNKISQMMERGKDSRFLLYSIM